MCQSYMLFFRLYMCGYHSKWKMMSQLVGSLLQLFPPLYEAGRLSTSDEDLVNSILTDAVTALTNEFNGNIQVHTQCTADNTEQVSSVFNEVIKIDTICRGEKCLEELKKLSRR